MDVDVRIVSRREVRVTLEGNTCDVACVGVYNRDCKRRVHKPREQTLAVKKLHLGELATNQGRADGHERDPIRQGHCCNDYAMTYRRLRGIMLRSNKR